MNQASHKTIIALAVTTLMIGILNLFNEYGSTSEQLIFSQAAQYLHLLLCVMIIIALFKLYQKTSNTPQQNPDINKLTQELSQQKFALDQHSIIAITDIKGTITYVNDKFISISEYSEDELIGKNHRILNSGSHSSDFFRNMYLTISSGKVWKGEIQNKSKSGKSYWVDTTIVPFTNNAGKVSSYIAIRTDITQRIKDASNLLKAKEDAESADLAKGEFLANMSHEIRTPMNGILGMLGIIEKTELNPQQKKHLELAQNSARTLLTIINDILDFSKIDAGQLQIESIDFDLRKLIDDFAASQAIRINEKNLELIVDTRKVLISHVKGDPVRLQQILTNLVSNSLKFTNKGEIKIKAALHDSGESGLILYCSISDTGIGIPKNKQSNLFDLFTQADSSTTRQYGGTGLGLSISKRLCTLMDGSISLHSEEGSGSRFYFSIQLKKSTQESHIKPESDIKDLHVLIVDKNDSYRLALKKQLVLWGANVTTACNANNALSKIHTARLPGGHPVNLVITDLNLPDMSGVELMKSIRFSFTEKISLAITTQISHQFDMSLISDSGFQFHITKPITTESLLNLLSDYKNPSKQKKEAPVQDISHIDKAKTHINNTKSILLVEDNLINQEVAKTLLEDLGFHVCIASNGLEALDILRAKPNKFDLILMDCQMPELDGYETTKAIRRSEAGEAVKHITIIAMTANALKGDKEKCINAGMNDYISKPVDPELLKEMLSL